MRAAALVALCACGRIGFDAHPDDAPADAPDIGFFLSPTGNDSNPGTRAEPWLTFDHALLQLAPGDRLNLLDGDYDAKGPTGALHVDCTSGPVNGTAGAAIVVRADHPRRAHLFNTTSPLAIAQCSYWEFDDLWLEGIDDGSDIVGPIAWVHNGSSNVVLHGLLLVHVNRHNNNNAVEVGQSMNIIVEDSEAYDYIVDGFVTFESRNTTFRRLYANGRGTPDIDYVSSCAGGDHGVVSYYAQGGAFQDLVVENVCRGGIEVEAGQFLSGNTDIGDGHHFANSIVLGPVMNAGFEVYSDCPASSPCTTPDGVARGNTFTNCAAIGGSVGFQTEAMDTQLTNVTAILPTTGVGIFLTVLTMSGGYSPTGYVTSALVTGGNTGIQSANQLDWTVMTTNVFGVSPAVNAYVPNDSHVTGSTTSDPMLGACKVYRPPGALQGAGADIRTLASTGAPFWLPDGTFAGCGAVVPGVNDDPATSCIGVHQRLNVGANGCALP